MNPRVMGSAVGISPLVVLFSASAVVFLFGGFSVLLSVPIAAVIVTLVDVAVRDKDPAEEETPTVLSQRRNSRSARSALHFVRGLRMVAEARPLRSDGRVGAAKPRLRRTRFCNERLAGSAAWPRCSAGADRRNQLRKARLARAKSAGLWAA